jgi:hypothetical protein
LGCGPAATALDADDAPVQRDLPQVDDDDAPAEARNVGSRINHSAAAKPSGNMCRT